MVQFDELKFNTEGNLVIKVSVPDKEYFTDVYLDTVKIDTQTSFNENGPSDTCVYSKTLGTPVTTEDEEEDSTGEESLELQLVSLLSAPPLGDEDSQPFPPPSLEEDLEEEEPTEEEETLTPVKSAELVISPMEILSQIDGNIFFVWVTAKGTPALSTPCGQDVAQKMMPVLDKRYIYKMFTPLLKTLQCECGESKEFNSLMLKWKAVEYNLLAGNYTQAIEYWNNFFTQINKVRQTKSCGCNGKSL